MSDAPTRATPPRAALRQAMADGRPVLGTFLKLPGIAGVDLARQAGFDFVVVDLEHSTLSEAEAYAQLLHASATGLAALARIPEADADRINRLLEAGAAGIQLSTLRSRVEADRLVAASRYAPGGGRSVSLSHPQAAYGAVPLTEYLAAEAAAPTLCVGQIETAATDDPLADVVARLDVAFIGTTDLSVALGRPGQLDSDEVRARLADIATAADAAGTVLGAFAGSAAEIPSLLALGARYIVAGSDAATLGRALTEQRRTVSAALTLPEDQ